MARGKRVKAGGKARITSRRKQPSRKSNVSASSSHAYSPATDSETFTFTLRDAARSSEHPRSFWSSSSLSLRHRTMHFIPSNAPLDPRIESDTPPDDLRDENVSLSSRRSAPIDHTAILDPEGAEENTSVSFPYDPVVNQAHQPETAVVHGSPRSSISSDEVVFVGRNNVGRPSKSGRADPVDTRLARSQPHQMSPLVNILPGHSPRSYEIETLLGAETETVDDKSSSRANDDMAPVAETRRSLNLKNQRQSQRRRTSRISAASSGDGHLEDIRDDYIANMLANGEFEAASELKETEAPRTSEKNGWTSSDIEDFEDMSTSEDGLEAVQQVLSKRYRSGKLQYLVVGANQTVDDAKWVTQSALIMPGAAVLIEAFEKEGKHSPEYQQSNSDSDEDRPEIKWSSNSESSIEEDEDEDFEDEKDLVERRMARMTDEHIARLFQKQESLGLNSEDLQIFDGAEDFEFSEDALYDRSRVLSRKKRDQKRRKRQADALFDMEDDMMLEGDEYGDFDVMDHERPSLNRTNDPYGNPFLLGLSDTALAQDLRDTWATDRRKKRLKKQEREELRAQGLLGKKNKFMPDLKAKYDSGMSLTHIEEELERFLYNGQQDSLSLPPMAKQERKVIHDIANAFGLKSKSQGSNKKRFPVLYKTSKTVDFDDTIFERLRTQLHRRFLPRLDRKGKGVPQRPRRGGTSGRGPGDIGYRDGEIVGAAAPELGAGNRGRTMLEKMGWSTGTALGALNNQGILTPIEHVVKNSRAGLG